MVLTNGFMSAGGVARVWGFLDARAAAPGGGPSDSLFGRHLGGGVGGMCWPCGRQWMLRWATLVSAVPWQWRYPDRALEALFGGGMSSLGLGRCSRVLGVVS